MYNQFPLVIEGIMLGVCECIQMYVNVYKWFEHVTLCRLIRFVKPMWHWTAKKDLQLQEKNLLRTHYDGALKQI